MKTTALAQTSESEPVPAELIGLLAQRRDEIVEAAERAIARNAGHYGSAGSSVTKQRLVLLFDHLEDDLIRRDLSSIIQYAQEVAEERFRSGYDLSEVQTAFNALEEAVWGVLLRESSAKHLARELGLVSTILGAGKDALARRYVSLAARTHAPSLDLSALFRGGEGA